MNDNKNRHYPSEVVMKLIEVLSNNIGEKKSIKYNLENVVIQPSGKSTIWKLFTSTMERGINQF